MGKVQRSGKREPGNLYQRDGVFYGRITVNGREHRRSLKTRNRREAERRLDAWLKERSPYKGTIRHTFKEAAALWLESGEWKPKTTASYIKLLTTLLQPAYLGDLYWDQVDKASLQGFIESRRAAGSGTATINRYLSIVSGIADHVKELEGWPEVNPVGLLAKKPRREKRNTYIRPPVEDLELYFARMHGTFGDLCRLALLTGARMDELATLKAVDARGGKLQLWMTKHRFRVIPLSAEALAIVNRQPEHRSGYLFVTKNGGPYKRVTEMWREVRNRAQKMAQGDGRKLLHVRFHDLRHEYAIRYLESGGSIYTLQQLLGHSTLGQTEHYLAYLTPAMAEAAKR